MLMKILAAIISAILALITVISAVDAYSTYYSTSIPVFGSAGLWHGSDQFNSYYHALPVIQGPYERYFHISSSPGNKYLHDDFNHFDSFTGYRDLDVYYPERGIVDIIRNERGSLGKVDASFQLDFRQAKVMHVYGALPNGGYYRKHYYHDHAPELQLFHHAGFMPSLNILGSHYYW